jgi:hypothetical protein
MGCFRDKRQCASDVVCQSYGERLAPRCRSSWSRRQNDLDAAQRSEAGHATASHDRHGSASKSNGHESEGENAQSNEVDYRNQKARQASDREPSETHTQVVASSPHFRSEQNPERPRIAMVDVGHVGIADQPPTCGPDPLAQIDVLADDQSSIESADSLERFPADSHVPASQPLDVVAACRAAPEATVHALDPCSGFGREAGRPDGASRLLCQRATGGLGPTR